MGAIRIGSRLFTTPILVPSVSSFETQLPPVDGVRLQSTLNEPITLVSAFDVHRSPNNELENLCRAFRKDEGVILLDSGGYEASRIKKYARDQLSADQWSYDAFVSTATLDIHDFAFSFDYFVDDADESGYELTLISEIQKNVEDIGADRLIPVVHLSERRRPSILSLPDAISIFSRIAAELKPRFIAIPERELGSGILDRTRLVRRLVEATKSNNEHTELHILGCGNLLSVAFLASAGAAMFDGLEWCRTYAASDFHLHHFQQKSLFKSHREGFISPAAEFFLNNKYDYETEVAGRNLISFQAFSDLLQEHIGSGTVSDLIRGYYGEEASKAFIELHL